MGVNRPSGLQAKAAQMGAQAAGGMGMGGLQKATPATPLKKGGSVKKGNGMKKMTGMGASKMGAVKTAAPSRDGVATKGKTKGKMVKMMNGGMPKTKMMRGGGKC